MIQNNQIQLDTNDQYIPQKKDGLLKYDIKSLDDNHSSFLLNIDTQIGRYLSELNQLAKTHLANEYHLSSFKISDFQAINFFLIDRALNQNQNLFIQSYDKDLPSLSQFPTVLAVAISLFYKNYCDDKTEYKVGDIIQGHKGIRGKIVRKENDSFYINIPGDNSTREVTLNQLKKNWIITNSDISNRRVKTKFNDYKELYDLIFNVKTFPSNFKYKTVIILEKKEFEEEIKNQKYTDIDILKAIPIRWISRNGTTSWNYIPIEPMIYCVPDYETFQEHILEKGEHIEALIIIGKNKYKEDTLSKLKRDLREEKIPMCLIIGTEPFADNVQQFLKWRWTYKEFSLLEQKKQGIISSIVVNNQLFETSIKNYIDFLNELEIEFNINLNKLKLKRKFLYPLTLALKENSRNISQLDYVNHLLKKNTTDEIIENLYNQNIETLNFIVKANGLIDDIFINFDNSKLRVLSHLNDIDILVVPEYLLMNWKCEYQEIAKICSFKEFNNKYLALDNSKKVVFLSIFSNGIHPFELIEKLNNSSRNYLFLSYAEEIDIIDSLKSKIYNDTIDEYISVDRQKITGMEYSMSYKEVKVSDIIEDIHLNSHKELKDYKYAEQEQVNYLMDFENENESLICEGSKAFLLFSNGTWVKTKVSNLRPADQVRVYNNLSKERLYEIAVSEDKLERFSHVEMHSKMWKNALKKFYYRKRNEDKMTIFSIFNLLKRNGLSLLNPSTLHRWMHEENERFPNATSDLIAIKETINDPFLNENFELIKLSKRFYRGIMISLGRDLSDDVMEYIITNGKEVGKILSKFSGLEIGPFVQKVAPVKIIKNISITVEDESN